MSQQNPTNVSAAITSESSAKAFLTVLPSPTNILQEDPPEMRNNLQNSISLTCLTSNLEGFKRNLYSLRKYVDAHQPDLIFLSEPQIFHSDLLSCMSLFKDDFHGELNSEDKFETEIAMTRTRSTGGTMVMWKTTLDSYITVHQVNTTSFLPVVYSPPGSPVSIHIALYLPTSGREDDFLDQLAQLKGCIAELSEKYEDCLLFIRGDGNVNKNNKERANLLKTFLSSSNLLQIPTNHNTYHHFLGGGSFDSDIDIILQSMESPYTESISAILCKKDFPDIDSHHDIIISAIKLPYSEPSANQSDLLEAPKVITNRQKIVWSDEGISKYEDEVATKLSEIRMRWLNPLSKTSLSILLAKTYELFNEAAKATNRSVDLNSNKKPPNKKTPKEVKSSEILLKNAQEAVLAASLKADTIQNEATNDALKEAKIAHRSVIRRIRSKEDKKQNEQLFSILKTNPSSAFNTIRKIKKTSNVQVPHITVGGKKYAGDRVIDGLYESILKLKSLEPEDLTSNTLHTSLQEDYLNIKYLCSHKVDLPPISLEKSDTILKNIKPAVNDLFSITANHFIHAGIAGHIHFNLLLNAFIIDVNNASVEELNSVYALLLYKGHSKDRTLASSYRTISTCPLVAKGLDMYVRELFIANWNSEQASTQYQGEGSSHELASLLITEAVQFSKFNARKPIFTLFLDAESAFDNVIIQYLVRQLYISGMEGNSLLYLDKRLSSRLSFLEYNRETAGPIHDECGLEQGGVSSSDLYKIYNNQQLLMPQDSKLGVDLGHNLVISAVGQADDTALMSNDLQKLKHILDLVVHYCDKFHVSLSTSKTKLMMIPPPRHHSFIPYNPISISGAPISFVDQAEHVGVVRSTLGNMPNLLLRIAAFKRALGSVISCGLARGSRSNPAASLRILSTFGTPVLMSGLGSLVLSSKEAAAIDQQFKKTLQNIMKLSSRSPAALVYFTAGSLPGAAIIHLRQLSLFGMICRLPSDPLNHHARHVLLTASYNQNSWFVQVRNLLQQYQLPHPLLLLEQKLPKEQFKKQIKAKVLDYWEIKLRQEAAFLPSLSYFNTAYYSLSKPHKLWTTAGQKPYEVSKARIQLLFLCSQYPSGSRTRHWSPENPLGLCSFPPCRIEETVETPEHILLDCAAYKLTRKKLISMCLRLKNSTSHSIAISFLTAHTASDALQLLLDCSSIPEVILAAQLSGEIIYNDLFYIGRSWCFSIHRERMKMLGRWNLW